MQRQFMAFGLIACLLPLTHAAPSLASSQPSGSISANAVLGSDFIIKKKDSLCGLRAASQLTNPAFIDYDKVMKVTPQIRQLKSEGIEESSARGIQLRTGAAELLRAACMKTMRSGGYCSIGKKISRRDGQKVTDITGIISRQILLSTANSFCRSMKLAKVKFGRSPDRVRRQLEIEALSYRSGGLLTINGGLAGVTARWKSPSAEAWEETEAVLADKCVDAVSARICDEAKTYGLAATSLIPRSMLSPTATEQAMIPVTYLGEAVAGKKKELLRAFVPITCVARTRAVDAHWAISSDGVGFASSKAYGMSFWHKEKGLQLAYLSRDEVDLVLDANYEVDNLDRALPNWEDEEPEY